MKETNRENIENNDFTVHRDLLANTFSPINTTTIYYAETNHFFFVSFVFCIGKASMC